MKKPAAYSMTRYVRHGAATRKSRKERRRDKRTLKDILTASDSEIVALLKEDGVLKDLEGQTCAKCNVGKLGPLKDYGKRGQRYRCSQRGCQQYALPHQDRPIFTAGFGIAAVSLQDQAAVLFCALHGVSATACHALTGMNHKMIEGLYRRLDEARTKFVEREEGNIEFGGCATWKDVEADEVDLRKSDVSPPSGSDKTVEREQWCGVVERGRPQSLALFRLNPQMTKPRSPGPGPIRKTDWIPFITSRLENRQIILHTDGARSYKAKAPGVIHDVVVHKKKMVTVGGRAVRLKPKFVRLYKHKLPCGKTVDVKGGTQIIDRFWSHLRSFLRSRSSRVGTFALRRRVRSAQWAYWNRDQDLWLKAGEMITSL